MNDAINTDEPDHLRSDNGVLRLNLGCGPLTASGWENLDKSPNVLLAKVPMVRSLLLRARLIAPAQAVGFPPGVKFADLTRRLPYADHSAGFIYSGHMIEHISPVQASALLNECRRVLAPGGQIRFSTPDLREFIDEYLGSADDPDAADGFMRRMGTYVESEGGFIRRFVNRNVSAFHHQWLYDEASLRKAFEAAGFSKIEFGSYRDGRFPDLDELEIRPGGLFIQATG